MSAVKKVPAPGARRVEAPAPGRVASVAGPGNGIAPPPPAVAPAIRAAAGAPPAAAPRPAPQGAAVGSSQPPAADPVAVAGSRRLPTGVKRLDQLLGGGIAPGSAVLLYGPPFLGKEVLARRFFQTAVESRTPGVYVLTNAATADVRKDLAESAAYTKAESQHLARFVDTYSRSVGADDAFRDAEFLDGALDLNGITLAVNKVQADIIADHDAHAFVLDSISTLVAYTNPATAFRFLQTLIGRTRRVGATSLFLMDQGMHADADVQMFKHLMTGVIEVRDANGKPQMRVEGLGAPVGVGWVDYKFDKSQLEITGSFAAGRIR
ncbi:MAG: RAD55 family ATPase [Candidatus Thermoplasmatota archaeon]